MEPDGVIEVSESSVPNRTNITKSVLNDCDFKAEGLASLQSNWNEITDNFDDMNLKETLLRGIYAYGFEKPSAIQQRAIVPCIKGNHCLLETVPGLRCSKSFFSP